MRFNKFMKLVILSLVVLLMSVFVGGALGDEWDSFDGNDSSGSSVGVSVKTGGGASVETDGSEDIDVDGEGGATRYTLEFYIALGVGVVGILIVGIFLYFFLRKPKNRWKKGS